MIANDPRQTRSTPVSNGKSLVDLVKELRDEGVLLLRQEVELAKTEATEKATEVGGHVAKLAVGGVIACAGMLVLLAAVSILAMLGLQAAGVGQNTSMWLGPALVGLIVSGIGAALLMKAKRNLAQTSMVPRETVASLKENKEWTQTKLSRK